MTAQPTPIRGAPRWCRGAALAVTSATLAVTAHAVAGGGLPNAGLTVLLTVGVAAVGVALADRRRSTGAILAVLGGAQLATHVLLSLGESMPMAHDYDLRMLAAHAAAVVVTALLLAGADTAVLRCAGLLAMLLPRLAVRLPRPPDVPVAVRPWARPRAVATSTLLCRSHGRRGPPLGC